MKLPHLVRSSPPWKSRAPPHRRGRRQGTTRDPACPSARHTLRRGPESPPPSPRSTAYDAGAPSLYRPPQSRTGFDALAPGPVPRNGSEGRLPTLHRAGERQRGYCVLTVNGAGKTTLVKLLTGLYRPTEGRVLYGGRDLAGLDMQAVRERQAAVFQDHVRYAFTLADNIGYGRAELREDRGAVEAAAVRGGADAVAAALPEGYDTLLTREFSGGTDVSGGQWQRVAVSRGFMREAPLVVLDEPTAALSLGLPPSGRLATQVASVALRLRLPASSPQRRRRTSAAGLRRWPGAVAEVKAATRRRRRRNPPPGRRCSSATGWASRAFATGCWSSVKVDWSSRVPMTSSWPRAERTRACGRRRRSGIGRWAPGVAPPDAVGRPGLTLPP